MPVRAMFPLGRLPNCDGLEEPGTPAGLEPVAPA